MANLLYVKNSNVWIEGIHVVAARHRHAPDVWSAAQNKICDNNGKLDFGKRFHFAGGEKPEVKKAALLGCRPPKNDSQFGWRQSDTGLKWLSTTGTSHPGEKIDANIVTTMMEDSYEILNIGEDGVSLVSGDADYVPAIEKLMKRGIPVHVVFWGHASRELRRLPRSS